MAGAIASGIARPGSVADHSPPFTTKLKTVWSYTSNSPCNFTARTQTTLRTPHYITLLLSLSWAPLVSRDVATYAGFLCDTAAVLGATIRETLWILLCRELRYFRYICFKNSYLLYISLHTPMRTNDRHTTQYCAHTHTSNPFLLAECSLLPASHSNIDFLFITHSHLNVIYSAYGQ